MLSFFKRNKIFSFLFLLTIVSFLLGIFFYANLDEESRGVVSHNVMGLLEAKNGVFSKFFFNQLIHHSIIWIFGISIIGIILVLILYMTEIFLFSFEFISCISVLKFSHIFFVMAYFLPKIISLFSLFFLTYYSLSFSIYLFRFLFFHKSYSFPKIMKRYSIVYLLSFLGIILSCLLEYLFFV